MKRFAIPVLIVLIGALTLWKYDEPRSPPGNRGVEQPAEQRPATAGGEGTEAPRSVPPEARATVGLILRGGPYPYRQDGSVFQNRERRLPLAERGYYHEYTVPTEGATDRGARRVVTGGNPPTLWYYTSDHYRRFQEISPDGLAAR